MVRCEIDCGFRRQITACFRFPEGYPSSAILIELKSKTLSSLLLCKLTELIEKEIKIYLSEAQIQRAVRFVKKFLDETPLSVCYNEISNIKKLLTPQDEFKLKQKSSTICLKIFVGKYYFAAKFLVPDSYFSKAARLTDFESNLTDVLQRFIAAQAQVISKQCSQPSATRLVKFKGGQERVVGGKVVQASSAKSGVNFEPIPSLEKVVKFVIFTVRQLVKEKCQLCRKDCLPDDPEKAQRDESADDHVERVYCGHLFHLYCLLTYMKTPPFLDGKKCPTCGEIVCHDKWRLNERLAEERWAHEQARERELEEVADFFH